MANPFEAPGDDALRAMNHPGTPRHDDIFQRPKYGSQSSLRKKVPPKHESHEEEEEYLTPETVLADPQEASPKAILSNPSWCMTVTRFHEEAEVSVELSLPDGKRNLTRVEAELHAVTPEGSQLISKTQGHADSEGKAKLKVPVYQPQGYLEGAVEYFLVFKHKLAEALSSESILRKVSDMALKSADHVLIPGIAFPENSSFIDPKAAPGLKKLEQKFGEWSKESSGKSRIVIFGHADIGEKDPKALSERRAQSAHAFITNNAGTWEKLYLAEKWGLSALQALLKDLGYYAGKIDGSDGPKTQAGFRSLQKKAGLPETGKEDPAC